MIVPISTPDNEPTKERRRGSIISRIFIAAFFLHKSSKNFSKKLGQNFFKKKWPLDSHKGAERPKKNQNRKNKSGNTG